MKRSIMLLQWEKLLPHFLCTLQLTYLQCIIHHDTKASQDNRTKIQHKEPTITQLVYLQKIVVCTGDYSTIKENTL